MEDWKHCKLGDLIEIKHGFAFKGEFFSDSGQHVLLTPGNFREEGGLKLKGDKEKYYTAEFPADYLLRRGDLLVAMTDLTQNAPILGSPAFIPANGKYLHNQRLGKVVNQRPDEVSTSFLFYLFNTLSVRGQIKGSATGATVRHTSPSRIYDVSVTVPPLPIQRRIAGILSAYDDLIENSQRRIKILEEMARRLYREWFVHFRFPGHEGCRLVESPLGEIPEGWEVRRLEEVCRSIQDGDWIETKDQGGEDYRLLQISNVGVGEFIETDNFRYVTQETFSRLRCNEIVPGDLLVARMPTPIGRGWLATEMPWRMITAVDVAIIRAEPILLNSLFLVRAWNENSNLKRIAAQASGTTRLRITRRELAAMEFVIPPISVQKKFAEAAEPQSAMIKTLQVKSQNLRLTRDLLLPRLLSGQIDVEAISQPALSEA